nr:prephenate dehydrogenase/arogenate dehydrogenase family protein [Rubrobacter indicoceani]
MGGSVGLAARRAGWHVSGVDLPGSLAAAEAVGAIDRAATLTELRASDVIVLAAPISRIKETLPRFSGSNALITDVASTKGGIVAAAEASGLRFVGGHPMAGSQLSGVANARADLFTGARYFLTPTDRTDPEDYREVQSFVRTLGAVPTAVEPEKHDLLMAALSHLPHMMAAALLDVAAGISPEALSFAGPAFRDLTRVGASNPELWSDILSENSGAVQEVLEDFVKTLEELGAEVENRKSITRRFSDAREAYDTLGGILVEKSGKNVDLAIPVENRPGTFAEVTTLMGSNSINILDLYVRHSNTERAALVLTVDSESVAPARKLLGDSGFASEVLG